MSSVNASLPSFRAFLAPRATIVETADKGQGDVLPVSIKTDSAQEFAAIAQSAKSPAPTRVRLAATLPLTSGLALGGAAAAIAAGMYTEAEFGVEVANFLREPGLRLTLV